MHTINLIKAHYHIIFLGASLLICAASISSYWLTASERAGSVLDDPLVHHPYQYLLSDTIEAPDIIWEPPLPQDSEKNWKFSVFTPPKIWFDRKARKWVAESPISKPPLEIQLIDIQPHPFRLHFKGYSTTSAEAKLLFENTETGQAVRGSIGDRFPEQEFVIRSFKETLVDHEDGTKTRSATAVIIDQRSGEKITLIKGKPHYTDNFIVTLQEIKNPSTLFTLKAKGASFSIRETVYTLKAVDFQNQRVTLETKSLKNKPKMIYTLGIRDNPSS